MPDEELFEWKEVKVVIPEEDMPGRPIRRIKCEKCGEHVQDSRDVNVDGRLMCKACAGEAYYKLM
jgi:formylmethanofuran dehydrogenase subunit E